MILQMLNDLNVYICQYICQYVKPAAINHDDDNNYYKDSNWDNDDVHGNIVDDENEDEYDDQSS